MMAKILDFTSASVRRPPQSVWVVFNKDGVAFVAGFRQVAMDHAGYMAADFPDMGPWCVCEYEPKGR